MTPIHVTNSQMNLILMAVEHGFREHERGKNLQGALASVFELYCVEPPRDGDDYADRAEWKARR